MRKTTSRLAAAILAVATLAASAVMAAAPAHTAHAVTENWPTSEIVVHQAMPDATFEAYRVLNSTDDGNNHYSYTLRTDRDSSTSGIAVSTNDTAITNALQSVTGKQTTSDIVALLRSNAGTVKMEKLLKSLYNQLSANKVVPDATAKADTAEDNVNGLSWEPHKATFSDMPQGWYLIVPTSSMVASDPAHASGNTDSLLIANTANSTNDEEGNPGVDLYVKPVNVMVTSATDGNADLAKYQDDYAVDTDFTWSATSTVPTYADLFAPIKYAFNVTLPAGVTADALDANGCPNATFYEINKSSDVLGGNDPTPTATQISGFNSTKNTDGTCTYAIDDLTQAKEKQDSTKSITINSDTQIRLDMKAKLNSNATLGTNSNVISATVSYPGSMLDSSVTTTTAASTATLYTYKLTVENTDNAGKPLSNGAKYSLYRCDDTDCNTQVGTETPVSDDASSKKATAVFSGLDSGTYELRETGMPAGYSGAAPVQFKVTSSFDNGSVTLTSDNPSVVVNPDASLTISVKNTTSGGLLPSTGGVGVIILYVCGLLLVAGAIAGIVVAARRRNRE